MTSIIVLIVAMAAGLVTFFVARQVFQERLKLGPPSLLAALTAGLAFLGLSDGGKGLISVLFLPYEALALTLLLIVLFCLVELLPSRVNRCRTRPSRPRASETLHAQQDKTKPPLPGAPTPPKGPACQSPLNREVSSLREVIPGAQAAARRSAGARQNGLALPHASTPLGNQPQQKDRHEA